MTEIALYGGPLKRSIIMRAYGLCGQSVTEFELSPEEYSLSLQSMNDLAATLGAGLGYNFPDGAYEGNPEDESGLAKSDVLGFTVMLAQEIAPNIGKAFTPNGAQATAKSGLIAKYQIVPTQELGRQTIRGAGNRMWGRRSPFFITPIPDDEIIQ